MVKQQPKYFPRLISILIQEVFRRLHQSPLNRDWLKKNRKNLANLNIILLPVDPGCFLIEQWTISQSILLMGFKSGSSHPRLAAVENNLSLL